MFQQQTRRLASELQLSLSREMTMARQLRTTAEHNDKLAAENERLRQAYSSKQRMEREAAETQHKVQRLEAQLEERRQYCRRLQVSGAGPVKATLSR